MAAQLITKVLAAPAALSLALGPWLLMATPAAATPAAARVVAPAAPVGPVTSIFAAAAGTTPAPAAALTLTTTIGRSRESRTYLVLALGRPPVSPGPLVDAAGENSVSVSVTSAAGSACTGDPAHLTGLGTDPWCVHLDGVSAGDKVTGQLTGTDAVLTLTVQARHSVWLPAGVAALTLIVAVLIAWAAGTVVPAWITQQLLTFEGRSDAQISGLNAWAAQANGRLSPGDVLARVRWAKRFGRDRALAARTLLDAELKAAPAVIPSCPLRTSAEHEAARTTVAVSDLLTPSGAVAVSPAERLLEAVESAASGLAAFDEIHRALQPEITRVGKGPQADAIVRQAHEGAEGFLSEFTLDRYLNGLRDAAGQLGLLTAPPEKAAALAHEHAGLAGAVLNPAQPSPANLGRAPSGPRGESGARAIGEVVPVALLTLTLMAAAVAGVLATQYAPNPTFGTGSDYFALAATAFGSAQAAAVLALLLQLRGPADFNG